MSSSSSTLFIALQCCQCSTMQVKQKKKSSNKWSCAVCNQKQSVRKVFAQGNMAKDIRIFVQNFNMSRKSLQDDDLAGTLDLTLEHADANPDFLDSQKKKRNDWTAYLDKDNHHAPKGGQHDPQHGDDFEPLVVTELPKGMLKKGRFVDNATAGSDKHFERPLSLNSQGDDFEPLVVTELPKSMLKKRRLVDNATVASDKHFERPLFQNSQDTEKPIHDQRITLSTESISERNNKVTTDNQRTQKCEQTISNAASKWNDYLAEDNDNLELGWNTGFNFKDPSGSANNSILLEAMFSEQRVEDDIHPDFLGIV